MRAVLVLCIIASAVGIQLQKKSDQHKHHAIKGKHQRIKQTHRATKETHAVSLAEVIAIPTIAQNCEQYYGTVDATGSVVLPMNIDCGPCGVDVPGMIYGSNPYSIDSYACEMCIHAGIIGPEGGKCQISAYPELDTLVGSSANGIDTMSWDRGNVQAYCVSDLYGCKIPFPGTTTSTAAATSTTAAPVSTTRSPVSIAPQVVVSTATPTNNPSNVLSTSTSTPTTPVPTTYAPSKVTPKIEPSPDAPIMHTTDWIHAIVLGPDEVPPSLPGEEFDVDDDEYGSGYDDYGSGSDGSDDEFDEDGFLQSMATYTHRKESHLFDHISGSGAENEAEAGSGAQAELGSGSEAETGSGAEVEAEPEDETASGAEDEAGSGVEAEAGSKADAGVGSLLATVQSLTEDHLSSEMEITPAFLRRASQHFRRKAASERRLGKKLRRDAKELRN